MYRPRHFDIDDPPVLSGFMREHSFVLLVTAADGVPVASLRALKQRSLPSGVSLRMTEKSSLIAISCLSRGG